MPLENEDSFGPFMCIGVSFAYYSYPSQKNKLKKRLLGMMFIICIIGVIVSFARGTFLSFLLLLIYFFFRSSNKGKLIAFSFLMTFVFLIILKSMYPNFYESYKTEMSTIWEQGTQQQTAHDRVYLCTKAWDMFVDHPLVGVGPNCYGFRLPRYSDRADVQRWGVRYQTYGRVTHNMFFQILADMGFLGVSSLLIILFFFFKKIHLIKASTKQSVAENQLDMLPTATAFDKSRTYY